VKREGETGDAKPKSSTTNIPSDMDQGAGLLDRPQQCLGRVPQCLGRVPPDTRECRRRRHTLHKVQAAPTHITQGRTH
jgi:hypothetical protein